MQDNKPKLQLETIFHLHLSPDAPYEAHLLFDKKTSASLKPFLKVLSKAKLSCKTKAVSSKGEGSYTTVVIELKNPSEDFGKLLNVLSTNNLFCHENGQANMLLTEGCKRFFEAFFQSDKTINTHPINVERELLLLEIADCLKNNKPEGTYTTPAAHPAGIKFTPAMFKPANSNTPVVQASKNSNNVLPPPGSSGP